LKEIALNSTIPAVAVFFCNNRNTTTASSPVELKYPEKYGKKKHKINVNVNHYKQLLKQNMILRALSNYPVLLVKQLGNQNRVFYYLMP